MVNKYFTKCDLVQAIESKFAGEVESIKAVYHHHQNEFQQGGKALYYGTFQDLNGEVLLSDSHVINVNSVLFNRVEGSFTNFQGYIIRMSQTVTGLGYNQYREEVQQEETVYTGSSSVELRPMDEENRFLNFTTFTLYKVGEPDAYEFTTDEQEVRTLLPNGEYRVHINAYKGENTLTYTGENFIVNGETVQILPFRYGGEL